MSDGKLENAETVLEVNHLAVTFTGKETVHAVRDFSFTVHKGEVVAIVGESGSGKSVSAMSLLGLLPRNAVVSGDVKLDGKPLDVSYLSPEIRKIRGRQVSMIFQDPLDSLDPVFTVGEQIAEAVRVNDPKADKATVTARVIDLLKSVELPEPDTLRRKYPHQLSGGQQQRILIAIALAGRPRILLADEPTTALDVTVQQGILDLLHQISRSEGVGVLIITHDMGVVADIADQVVVVRNGALVEAGETVRLFHYPQNDYTRELLDAVPKTPLLGGSLGSDHAAAVVSATGATSAPAPAASDEQPVLKVENLSVSYAPRTPDVVHGVSFDINHHEVLALVGESGSGKSTIVRCVLGLAQQTGGTVMVDGVEYLKQRRREQTKTRHKIGVIFQSPMGSLDPRQTLAQSIAEPLIYALGVPRGDALAKAEELMDRVHLTRDMATRYPSEISGGQRQRVSIARAIALNPELLIADEPTSALDVSVQKDVIALFRELQRDLGFACLFVSHDLPLVASFCHKVVVLQHGQEVEYGPVESVFVHPTTDYARKLILSAPLADPEVQHERRRLREQAATA
ncbi:dipeptide ABC transporter ATP-binding protein [Bifidobacterium avesanii]|uniref:Dipeptide ABC transporter ATP-binding protein n=1 Tax=Bifidobacterium avesanii TaxID=1798157 RepID=A0A7K3TF10_9BIFI|nr:ABC transporter ATP-binding protein [Bifidobacterium avesanii]KAB8295501.1 glutathione ABC transporter ATP-binding protein [Bifidobacterium avesanii]NEG77506.1 dipeptide ABC transporter ATP-binding protein [Bifidobacterium avesanii]